MTWHYIREFTVFFENYRYVNVFLTLFWAHFERIFWGQKTLKVHHCNKRVVKRFRVKKQKKRNSRKS
jgi:hypothetical protein